MKELVLIGTLLVTAGLALPADVTLKISNDTMFGVNIYKENVSEYMIRGNETIQEIISFMKLGVNPFSGHTFNLTVEQRNATVLVLSEAVWSISAYSWILTVGKKINTWGYGYFKSPAYMVGDKRSKVDFNLLEDYDDSTTCLFEVSYLGLERTVLSGVALNESAIISGEFQWFSHWLRYSQFFSFGEYQTQVAWTYRSGGEWFLNSDILFKVHPVDNVTLYAVSDLEVAISGQLTDFNYNLGFLKVFTNDVNLLVELYREDTRNKIGCSINYIPVNKPVEIYNKVSVNLEDYGMYTDSRILFVWPRTKLTVGCSFFIGNKESVTYANPILYRVYTGLLCHI
jgi:hypothetical protein